LVRVLSESSALLASSVCRILGRGKDVLASSLDVGLAELQLFIHVVFNGVKLLPQREVVSWGISGIDARRSDDGGWCFLFLPVSRSNGVDAASVLQVGISASGSALLDLCGVFGG
jgi:hypothetical protein